MGEQRMLTYADFAAFPEDGVRRELIGGELIVSPSPKIRHQVVLGRLYLAMGNHVAAKGGGMVFFAPLDVVLSNHDVVEPDLIVVLDDQRGIITEPNIQGPPALLIEIVSPSHPRLDRVRKRDLYATFGVSEYWIVDPDADRVDVYRLYDGAYGKPQLLEVGDVLEYARLPGLRIDLAGLFAD